MQEYAEGLADNGEKARKALKLTEGE